MASVCCYPRRRIISCICHEESVTISDKQRRNMSLYGPAEAQLVDETVFSQLLLILYQSKIDLWQRWFGPVWMSLIILWKFKYVYIYPVLEQLILFTDTFFLMCRHLSLINISTCLALTGVKWMFLIEDESNISRRVCMCCIQEQTQPLPCMGTTQIHAASLKPVGGNKTE